MVAAGGTKSRSQRRREEELGRLAEEMFAGEIDHREWNRALDGGVRWELAPDTVLLAHRGIVGNVLARRTGEGLVLVDTGAPGSAEATRRLLREWDPSPVHTIVYTHGHVDHVSGAPSYDREAEEEGWSPPQVLAHRNLPARFHRYRLTAGYNQRINARQFKRQARDFTWPEELRDPDGVYDEVADLEVGGVELRLRHGLGETDDHTWVWWPDRRLLCSGDFVIWAAPNCGNPQKVQRYVAEWADAVEEMAELEPEILVPGHGPPVFGAQRARTVLLDTAELLRDLHRQTVDAMNDGATLPEVVARVRAPEELLQRPWLLPIYDDPEFVVRNLWRLYGGWWDGSPHRLKPPPDPALAEEICHLAGGIDPLLDRAEELCEAGELALAASLVESAVLARPDSASAHSLRARIYEGRVAEERSLMARGVFADAAAHSRRRSGAS